MKVAIRSLLLLLACVGHAFSTEPAKQPNVVLIFTDDQGTHDVGCYGSEIRTPHIDSLARDGIKFTQWYSASSICTPSRFGLLTGQNPCRSRDRLLDALMFLSDEHKARGIHAGEKTVAAMMSESGYATALIGKWHLGHGGSEFLPTRHGFDSFYGHTGGCIDFYTMRYGTTPDWYRNEELVDVTGYATDIITDEAIRFLKQRVGEEPFLLYLPYNAPHFGKGWNDGDGEPVNQLQPPPDDLARVADITDITRRKYAAKVVNLDDAIGRVLATLDEEKLAESTLVIFITDHGGDPKYGGANAPFRGSKATLFEGGIRVPCLMRWPAKIKAGTESHDVLSSLDIAPTLCELADTKTEVEFDGVSFAGLLTGETWSTDKSRELYWELGKHDELGRGNWVALRSGIWKYLQDDEGNQYLFDLEADPSESRNLITQQAELKKRFALRARELGASYRVQWKPNK